MFEAETEVEAETEAKERLKRTHCKSKRLDYLTGKDLIVGLGRSVGC